MKLCISTIYIIVNVSSVIILHPPNWEVSNSSDPILQCSNIVVLVPSRCLPYALGAFNRGRCTVLDRSRFVRLWFRRVVKWFRCVFSCLYCLIFRGVVFRSCRYVVIGSIHQRSGAGRIVDCR